MSKLTAEEFINRLSQLEWAKAFTLEGEYMAYNSPVSLKCTNCGLVRVTTPQRVLNRRTVCIACHKRKGSSARKTTEEFKEIVFSNVGDEYTVLGEYVNDCTPILVRHNTCSLEYMTTLGAWRSSSRCPGCAKGGIRRNQDWFIKTLKSKVSQSDLQEYEFLELYKAYDTKIRVRHLACNTEYSVSPNKFIGGRRCPYCRISKGEAKIVKVLTKEKLFYIREYSFKELRYTYLLKFDFCVFLTQNNFFLIEYDGQQHFEPKFNFSIEKYQQLVQRDKLKDQFCKDKNIKLIRIPYTEFEKIEEILSLTIEESLTTIPGMGVGHKRSVFEKEGTLII